MDIFRTYLFLIPALHLCRLGEVWEESEEGRLSYLWNHLPILLLSDLWQKKLTRFVTVLHTMQKIAGESTYGWLLNFILWLSFRTCFYDAFFFICCQKIQNTSLFFFLDMIGWLLLNRWHRVLFFGTDVLYRIRQSPEWERGIIKQMFGIHRSTVTVLLRSLYWYHSKFFWLVWVRHFCTTVRNA